MPGELLPRILGLAVLAGCTASGPAEPAPAQPAPADPGLPLSNDHLRDRCDRPPPRRPAHGEGKGAEQVNYGRYFVTNATTAPIRITEPGRLLASEVAPGATEHIYNAAEGSGGHVRPSNFFDRFTVEDADGVLYSGVNNDDWNSRGAHCGRERYELIVRPRERPPAQPPVAAPDATPQKLPDVCEPPSDPPARKISHGRYFVTNATRVPITVTLQSVGGPRAPAVQEVAPWTTARVLEFSRGRGGAVRPTNALKSFKVEISEGTLSSAIRDEDWIDHGEHCGRLRYEWVARLPGE